MSDSLATQADEVLLRHFGERDDAAFDALVSRYKDRLIAVAEWLLGDTETAWPVVQQVFVRLYFGKRALRRVTSVSTWLYAETLRRIRGHRRRQRWIAAVRNLARRTRAPRPPESTLEPTVIVPEGLPDVDRLRHGLGILPEPLQEVYVLCDLQGLTVDEVGAILRAPVTEVQAQVEKARVVFREIVYQ